MVKIKVPSTIDTIPEEWHVDVLDKSYQLDALPERERENTRVESFDISSEKHA